MSRKEEAEILKKVDQDFEQKDASAISDMVIKMKMKDQEVFKKRQSERLRLIAQAQELVDARRYPKAKDILNHVISLSYFENEAAYGLMGDIYAARDDKEKAAEFYKKSGSFISLQRLRKL